MGHPLLSIFAVEDTAVQVTWRALPAARVCLGLGDHSVTVEASPPALLRRKGRPAVALVHERGAIGGPGAVTLGGLEPATTYELTVTAPGVPTRVVTSVTTLPTPPGRLRCKFATINDMHLAENSFGLAQTIEERHPPAGGGETYSYRCVRAAIAEAVAWGAEALVVKGDLTKAGAPVEFREAGELLAAAPVPVVVTFGNHEYHDVETDGRLVLEEYGIHVPRQPWAHDLAGIRVILAHTPRPDGRWGRVDARQRGQIVALAEDAPGPVFVAVHHQPQRWRVPNQYPPGIPGPEAVALLDALVAVNPATVFASGHTHRHRRHRHGPLVAVEVGSTKDYPGAWAGYAVHEGGIRQATLRIAVPDVIAWTETTARALGGLWGRWSPGRLPDRCFTHPWPDRN